MLENELAAHKEELSDVKANVQHFKDEAVFVAKNAQQYDDDPEYQLPEPKPFMSAKAYRDKIVMPLFQKLKSAIRSFLSQYFEKVQELRDSLSSARKQIWNLSDEIKYFEKDNTRLKGIEKNYGRLRKYLGGEQVNDTVKAVKEQEYSSKAARKATHYER